jgi:hypothetical protein
MLAAARAGLLGRVQQWVCEPLDPAPPPLRLLLSLNGRVGQGAVGPEQHGPCADGAHGPRRSAGALILYL